MIRFTCPHCHALLRSPDEQAGTAVACPRCQHATRVPRDTHSSSPPSPSQIASDPAEPSGWEATVGHEQGDDYTEEYSEISRPSRFWPFACAISLTGLLGGLFLVFMFNGKTSTTLILQ